jgi:hypothetical protein
MIRRLLAWLRRRMMWIDPKKMDQAKRDMEERIAMDKKQREANHEQP